MTALSQAARSRRKIVLEPMESRRHWSVTSWVGDTISELTDVYYGDVQFGSNGDPNGAATGLSGVEGAQQTLSFSIWDLNLLDGLDSGWKSVSFALNNRSNGDLSFKVGTSPVMTVNVGTSVAINSVTMRAAVQTASAQMDWRSITVKFYSGTTLVETDTVPNMTASTMNGGEVRESVAVVTPSVPNCTGVTVSAQCRLQAPLGSLLSPQDVFGQILIS